jgi:hypothetical protein
MAQKEPNRFGRFDEPVYFMKSVAGIQDQVVFLGFHQDTDGVPGFAVKPAVGAKKNDLHSFPPATDLDNTKDTQRKAKKK